jgi:murein DD-endopeptidase MepM/ murein hydrolase activator NlpD
MNSTSSPPIPENRGERLSIKETRPKRSNRYLQSALIIAPLLVVLLILAVYLYSNREQPDVTETPAQEVRIKPRPEFKEITGNFKKNQTITELLSEQGLSNGTIYRIVTGTRPVYNLAKVKADHHYSIRYTQDGKFRDFRYRIDNDRYLTVYHDEAEDCFVPIIKNFQYETRIKHVSAEIDDSLYAAILDIGEEIQLVNDMEDIFGYDIDFNTDIKQGDSFQALIEKKYLDGKFERNGVVLAASIMNRQKLLTGYRFEDENGKPAYYAPDGRALKRSFLKSPLRVFRISSRFSYHRMHPILKIVRPHLGVDYAAPIGSPVQAVASGVVVSAGRDGANGKMIKLRHAGGYETMYLHLSRIAVKPGTRVEQGQIIGNVGSSGLSTGPHLDFRIYRHGKAINPLKVIFPPAKPVLPEKFSRFAELRERLDNQLQGTNNGLKQASIAERLVQ